MTCGKQLQRGGTCGKRTGHTGQHSSTEVMQRAAAKYKEKYRVGTAAYEQKKRWERAWKLKQYGLTADDFSQLLEAQDGKCAICERSFTALRPPCIDHCHRTWTVRGLLCINCNRVLGWMHDDRNWLQNAADYLNTPTADQIFDHPRRTKDAPPEELIL